MCSSDLFEREQLATWNGTARSTAGLAWHEMVAAQANATPAAVAVRAGIEELTYAQLMARAATIADGLRSRGIAQGDVVGVFVERSADMVAAMLGAALCGAAYLPLDPAFPADRLEYMVQDAGAAVIITDDALRSAAERFDAPTIVVGLFML